MAGKSRACNKCPHLKIQCSLVSGGARQGAKHKAELDAEETAQPKWLKLVVKALGMRVELTMWEVHLEHLEFLRDLQELFERQLEEVRRLQQVVLVIAFAIDKVVE